MLENWIMEQYMATFHNIERWLLILNILSFSKPSTRVYKYLFFYFLNCTHIDNKQHLWSIQKYGYGWRTNWYSMPGLFVTSLVAGLLAIFGWVALWDCLECGGDVNFGLRDLGGMVAFPGIFYIGLLHNQGRKELWGRSGCFDWIHNRGIGYFSKDL